MLFSYDDTCLNDILEATVLREIYQAIGRIRPYRECLPGDEPIVYILTNVHLPWYEVRGYFTRKRFEAGIRNVHDTFSDIKRKDNRVRIIHIHEAILRMPRKFTTKQLYAELEKIEGKPLSKATRDKITERYLSDESLRWRWGITQDTEHKQTFIKTSVTSLLDAILED